MAQAEAQVLGPSASGADPAAGEAEAAPDDWGVPAPPEAEHPSAGPPSQGACAGEGRSDLREQGHGEADVAELALLALLQGQGIEAETRACSLEAATDHVLWALDISKRGPTGMGPRPPLARCGPRFQCCCALAGVILALMLLVGLTRATFREVSVENGILLASGVPAYAGDEPVAATAAILEYRRLEDCLNVPLQVLRNIRDVVLVHRGTWRSIRIARVLKFSSAHVWFEAPDGTGVRLKWGEAYLREGKLGDEQRLELGGELYNTTVSKMIQPTAFFEVVAAQA
mmetsp:Transcript_105601/g.340545  ORF Transcript_105601/g.340545 Transcript_105601/m.340545 type:complete len:286 (-) Transcript_105601:120-977(-)